MTSSRGRIEYDKYAVQFDHQNQFNPAYFELQNDLVSWLPKLGLGANAEICDLGAGTGNFVLRLSEMLPKASFVHLDKDSNMNALALDKYRQAGLDNVRIVDSYMQDAEFEPSSFDLVICINALNTAPPQLPTLRLIYSWIKPGGWLYLVDFGRKQNVYDWALYCAVHAARTAGLVEMIKYARGCAEGFRQNRNASIDQDAGSMWTHSTSELVDLVKTAGFHVAHSTECYRGYSDLVISQKDPIIVSESSLIGP